VETGGWCWRRVIFWRKEFLKISNFIEFSVIIKVIQKKIFKK
jgi:hypothetical protein